MTKAEKNKISNWANTLTDVELEQEYYKSVLDTLGSEAEQMYELGYDIRDIKEREQNEKYMCKRSDFLGLLCKQRGIKLWG